MARSKQELFDFVLDHYFKQEVTELDQKKTLHLLDIKYQAIGDAVEALGDIADIREMLVGLQEHFYTQQTVA